MACLSLSLRLVSPHGGRAFQEVSAIRQRGGLEEEPVGAVVHWHWLPFDAFVPLTFPAFSLHW